MPKIDFDKCLKITIDNSFLFYKKELFEIDDNGKILGVTFIDKVFIDYFMTTNGHRYDKTGTFKTSKFVNNTFRTVKVSLYYPTENQT